MAETIRGINVVIGADTTRLSKALSDVNQKSKDIQSELRQVERLLKFDPSNTELLAQKQKLLSEAVTNTSEKLERLKSVQQQVADQLARGEISEGQYRAFQREIVKTEQELQKLEDQLRSISAEAKKSADEIAESFKNVGDNLSNVGQTMTATVTAPVVAAGAAMLKSADDAEAAQGKLQASLGITAQEAEKLGQISRDVWKKGFGESVDEAAQAVSALYTVVGDIPEKELAALSKGVMTLTEAFGIDMTEGVSAVSTVMKNFKVDGQEALDFITYAAQNTTGVFREDLADALTELAPTLHGMGASGQEAFDLIIAASKSGMENFDALSSITQSFTDNLIASGKDTDAMFQKIGGNALQMWEQYKKGNASAYDVLIATTKGLGEMDNQLLKNQIGAALFGDAWTEAGAEAITSLGNVDGKLEGVRGAAEKAGDALHNNFGAKLSQALRELQEAISPALEPIADIITNSVVPAVKSMAEWFANLSPTAQKFTLAVAGILAVIGPLLMSIGMMMPAFTGIFGAITKVTDVVSKAGGVMGLFSKALTFLTGPVGIAVAAIAGLIAIGVLVYKNWHEIKAFLLQTWETIKSVAINVWNGIKSFLSATWNGIKTIVTVVWNGIKSYFTTVLNAYKIIFTTVWNAIKTAVTTVWNALKTAATTTFNTIKSVISTITNTIKSVMTSVWNGIKSSVTSIWNSLKSTASSVWNGIKSAISSIVNGIRSTVSSVFNSIKSTATSIWNGIKSAITSPIESAKNTVLRIIDTIKNAFAKLSIKIPKPKIPDIDVDWKKIGVGDLSVKIPTFSVNWHKVGGVFTKPVIFGNAGFGDVEEAIVPFEGSHARRIAGLIAKEMDKISSQPISRTTPAVIQIVTPDRRTLAQWLVDDITEFQEFNLLRERRFEGR
jgi:TP901 family phage tail tape measure protein